MRVVLVSTYDLGRQPFGLASPAAWLRARDRLATQIDAVEADEDLRDAPPAKSREFAEGLVAGVAEQLERIDRVIEEHSNNWALDRMARVDLALLRLAAYELLCSRDIPASVVINEAIEIGKRFGTRETPAFINGILDQVARHVRA